AASHPALVPDQAPDLALQMAEVRDPLPRAGHGEVLHTEVDADRTPARKQTSGSSASTVSVTYHRPSGSRDMITMAGSSVVTSTSGHDHTYRSGPSVLASRSTPPRMENADQV